jgi:polyvinyl alcohol dehydrogenase (cytochrome)
MAFRSGYVTLLACSFALGCHSGQAVHPAPDVTHSQPAVAAGNWLSAGHDDNNSRSQPLEHSISRENVGRLGIKWFFETEGDVWATPAVDDTTVYVPDASGNLFAVDRSSGELTWRRRIDEITDVPGVVARATPTIDGDVLYLGDQGGRFNQGATFFALNKRTGETIWKTKIDEQPIARVTQSAVVHGDRIYVGLSSVAESFSATTEGYKCCSFRGDVVALERSTGEVVWRTYLTPGEETPGYSGVSLWGSNPVIDVKRNSLYVTTGNNYTVPVAILDCQALPTPEEVEACVREVPGSEDNHFDAIVALDLTTGSLKWSHTMLPFDVWSTSCVFAIAGNEGNCTNPHGEDYDFGQGAIAYSAIVDGKQRDLLAAGQKSGIFWAVDPDDGSVVWRAEVGPGGSLGGMEWGSAYDGKRIYAAVANSGARTWTMPTGDQVQSGLWSALDPATGTILWQTAGTPAVTTANQGAVSTANGIMYAGTINMSGTMYALDGETGDTLWTFESGGSVDTAPAIVDGSVYWGSGYGTLGLGLKSNNVLYAFELDGKGMPPVQDAGALEASSPDAGAPRGEGLDAPTWSFLHRAYFAESTVGHCSNCHIEMATPSAAHQWLTDKGQINGASSLIAVRGQSRLTIFGGGMPPEGPTSQPQYESDITAWVAAGAQNN